jgi:hypothetical protein
VHRVAEGYHGTLAAAAPLGQFAMNWPAKLRTTIVFNSQINLTVGKSTSVASEVPISSGITPKTGHSGATRVDYVNAR